ncbi:hypothetical protein HNV11_21440 [Spirosoma taeanense]|uniref:Uncharacterized protein n=1 Tax=Spirosoma taeanense TaxID=2735870 RepID=A0A6M5YEL5_9BACT|nr:hypothetical protein [Spirosoma taeanense]QJW91760.1 hypothetical protein HNV11_21440 [Spirosoma taeanense]
MKSSRLKPFCCWLACLFCLVATSSRSQQLPFKGANTILITTDLADKEAYLAVAEVLTEQGVAYTGDNDFLIIRAPENVFAGSNKGAVFEGKLYINSGLAMLTGWLRNSSYIVQTSSLAEPNGTPVEYRKGSTAPQNEGFLFMDNLARKLQPVLHGVMSYKLQNHPLSSKR